MILRRAVNLGKLDPIIAENDRVARTRILGNERIHLNPRRRDAIDPNRSAVAKADRIASAVSVDPTNEAGKEGATQYKDERPRVMQKRASNPSNSNRKRRTKTSALNR